MRLLSILGVISLLILLNCQNDIVPVPIQHHSEVKQSVDQLSINVVKSLCPDGMIDIDNQYCIDQYEAPNEENSFPFACSSAQDAENYCQTINKRLCSIDEWQKACQGTDQKTCNTHKFGWKEVPWMQMYDQKKWDNFCYQAYKADPSGSNLVCKSNYQVYDMIGNVSEWVRMSNSKYGYAMTGGYFFGSLQGLVSCSTTNQSHGKTFNTYEAGIRCCKDISQ